MIQVCTSTSYERVQLLEEFENFFDAEKFLNFYSNLSGDSCWYEFD